MRIEGKSTRIHERRKINVPLQVSYLETDGNQWTENTVTEELTICGGGFTLSRPVEPTRLIQLSLQMPNRFRLYGHKDVKYAVWGIIRYIRLIETEISQGISIQVGTALIGEKPPKSFLENPATRYDINPVLRDKSFWGCRELPRRTGRYARSLEERQNIATRVFFQTIDEQGQIKKSVEAETLNISASGMSLVTNLPSEETKYVIIKSQDDDLALLAKARGIHVLNENSMRVHLEFISGKWQI